MVYTKNLNKKYALISVYDKKRLSYLCRNLSKYNYRFISTGGTSKKINQFGYKCMDITKFTGLKEILSGRIKTLNHKIHSALLYKRDDKKHLEEIKKLKILNIDLVVVNLYPFEKFYKTDNHNKIIEMIDIGGVSLLRSSSKNFQYITTISHVDDYFTLIDNLKNNNGNTDIDFRKMMAAKAFEKTSLYDGLVLEWLKSKINNKKLNLRYGENQNQKSYLVKNYTYDISKYQLSGKQMSYNNIIDVDSGIKCLQEFKEPTCIIIKHTNPCGVASGKNIMNAFKKAYECDQKSAFGGVILLNRPINKKLSSEINKKFFEIIVSSGFDKKSLEILKRKNNLILLKINKYMGLKKQFRSTIFGTLFQDEHNFKIDKKFIKPATNIKLKSKLLDDLIFCIKVTKHTKSNSIVLVKNKQTIGIGAGQTSRVGSLKIALKNATENKKSKNFVCGSDGFFPFTDSVKVLKNNHCLAIAQPSGSINDNKIVEYCKNNKISLYFTKYRLFKH